MERERRERMERERGERELIVRLCYKDMACELVSGVCTIKVAECCSSNKFPSQV